MSEPRLKIVRSSPSNGSPATEVDRGEPAAPKLRLHRRYGAGDVICDRYRLVELLGQGGMGDVWVARSLALDTDVAIKLLRLSAEPSECGGAARMEREARITASLAHPALVRVFDFGWTASRDPFLVMELVRGENLAVLLDREGRLPAVKAVQFLLPLADGLRCAHNAGVVHRDIKPSNILVAVNDFGRQEPKLLDFGIARSDRMSREQAKITQAGQLVGSPEYMSPERALGHEYVDERADVWALCVVLYEMLTGTTPFQHPNYNALMRMIVEHTPTSVVARGAGDPALWRLLERGLAKSADDRWSSMTELGEALAFWLYERGVKEDISGNSLRSVWLDGRRSGVRFDLSLQPFRALPQPDAPCATEPQRSRGTNTESATQSDLGDPRIPSQDRTPTIAGPTAESRPKVRGRRIWAIAAAVSLIALVGVLFHVVSARRPASAPPTMSAAGARLARAPSSAPAAPTEQASASTSTAPRDPKPTPTSSDQPSGLAPARASSTPPHKARPSQPSNAARAGRVRTAHAGKSYEDFGF